MKRSEAGQASAELVAIVPIILALALLLGQAVVAGHAAWAAAGAARAAARAVAVGGDAESVALADLPQSLREGASVDTGAGVQVRVRAPALIPGLPSLPVTASAALDPAASDSGDSAP